MEEDKIKKLFSQIFMALTGISFGEEAKTKKEEKGDSKDAKEGEKTKK